MKFKNRYDASWLSAIDRLTCAVCWALDKNTETVCEEKHHIQDDRGVDISNFATIPLCRKHHITKVGVHCGYPQKHYGLSEMKLYSDTVERVVKLFRDKP